MTAAISETMKYPVKPDSLKLDAVESMNQQEKDELAEAVICLSHAMKGRRLVTFGGEILKTRKALKQDDIEKGDLRRLAMRQISRMNTSTCCSTG